jgi:hypothetical protein
MMKVGQSAIDAVGDSRSKLADTNRLLNVPRYLNSHQVA